MRHCLPFILMVCVACSTSPKQKAEVEPLDTEFIPAASHDNGWQKRGEIVKPDCKVIFTAMLVNEVIVSLHLHCFTIKVYPNCTTSIY